ncbi:MAG: hypothetical protein Q8N18_19485 [Opitutaceae bacterium]|nr:hypothetical protein [Opitutaceae bacterium]
MNTHPLRLRALALFRTMLGLGLAIICGAPKLSAADQPARTTTVAIRGGDFLLNGRPTYEGRTWRGHRVEGLLMNNRVVQGTFDDLNPETVKRWAYPDTGRWDTERNNREFLAAMPGWKAHGVLGFTVNFQGGSPEGYSKDQPWENHPFNPDGSLRPAFMDRMKRILDEADRLGMVPIVGYFYFGQSGRLQTDENAIRATDTLTQWLLAGGWKNLLVEINNESNPKYNPPILRPDRVHELIARVRDTRAADGRRLLVGTSFPVAVMPTFEAMRASDFMLLHGNAFKTSAELVAKIRATRALDPSRVIPILVNEDDHYDFEADDGRLAASVAEHVSWGWFDWRRQGEAFDEGYQSLPTNWGLSSARKRAFHAKVAEITGTAPTWRTVETRGKPHARHEAAFVGLGSKLYLLGGRRIQPVDIYDPATHAWAVGKAPPVETHHFQPVVWENKIWLPGAMTGAFPREQALAQIPIYDPAADAWSQGPALPADRRRGGSGAVIHDSKLYVVCGIINGHWDGHVAWLDVLDLKTHQWSRLPDAPRARDHFQAAIIDGRIYVAGGRRSSAATKQVFELTIPEVDVFDLASRKWSTLPAPAGNLPHLRAGTMSLGVGPLLLVAGGESVTQPHAYTEVEALDTRTGTWSTFARFARGRHGSGLVRLDDTLYVAAGSGSRGGKPELDSLESFTLPSR